MNKLTIKPSLLFSYIVGSLFLKDPFFPDIHCLLNSVLIRPSLCPSCLPKLGGLYFGLNIYPESTKTLIQCFVEMLKQTVNYSWI